MTRIDTSGGSIVPPYGRPARSPIAVEERREQVGVVVRELALDDRRDALEAHAGVDRRRRQRLERAVRLPVELHEHVVPDLDEAVAACTRRRGTPAPRRARGRRGSSGSPSSGRTGPVSPIAQKLSAAPSSAMRVAPARTRARCSYASSSRGMPPSPLKIVGEEPVGRQLPHVGQQLPGERDRFLLEVVAEREVAEHLEERVMPERRPDVVEVVVLAADAHALLRRRRARVVAPAPCRGTRP